MEMEMESSRRSIERSREPGLKKPRLVEEAERDRGSNSIVDRDRPFPARVSSAGGAGALNSRFRERGEDREGREDSVRSTYQHQELVGQYKTALAELTFNSKPIITNLTIIAGENLHAAKGIAATVCTNILQVPSEQKLPSLYLLDSIVKNIGRDYIKYFAARLPEVFCKAYRQVDSSVHPGMRHLFGTWKGVFPPTPLHIIEKELGFQPAINGSSSGITTSRPDSQSQRPLHSIHVNPKYLEARQRLQQSSRAKGDSMGSTVTTGEDADRPERTAILGSAKPWADLPVKMHNIQRGQRGQSNEQDHEKNPGAGYGDYDLISDLPQHSDLESQRATERATEREGFHKPWYGSGTNAPDATIGRRNGFDTHAYENHRAPRPTQAVNQLHSKQNITNRSSRGMSRNWKNSEEEEYMWDDMNSRLRDRAETDNSRKDGWNRNDSEKPPSLQSSKWMPLGTDLLDSQWKTGDSFFRLEKSSRGGDRVSLQREIEDGEQPHDEQVLRSKINRETSTDSQSSGLGGQAVFGHTVKTSNHTSIAPTIAGQLEDHPTFLSGSLSKSMNMSLVRTGLQSHMEPSVSGAMHSGIGSLANTVSGSIGMFGHQQQHPPRPASPTALSSLHQRSHSPSPGPPHQHEKSYNLTDPDNPQSHSFPQSGQKPLQIAGLPNRALHPQVIQDSLPIVPQSQIQPVMVSQSPQQHLQSSLSSLMPFTQQRPHLPFSLLPQPEISQSSSQTKKPLLQPSILGTHQMVGPSDSSQSNNPVADLSVQSSTGSILATITKSGLVSNNSVTNSFPNTSYPELMMPSHSTIQPPLPSGPPPIQLAASSSLPPVTPTSVLGPTLTTHSLRALMPPLPPGPPPASSVVVTTSSQMSIPATAAQNPLSSLLSSLVAKGLISAPTKESPTENTSQIILTQVQNQTVVGLPTTSLQVSSTSPSFSIPSSTANELPFSESRKGTTALSQASIQKRKDLIGTEFRQDIIRELHPEAISGLFDDLPHQCGICGCRFELQEQFSKHLDWHASKKHELCSSIRVSRKWYLGFSEWVAGNTGLSIGPVDTPSVKGVVVVTEKCQLMVPADENQCICALCGEPFEDFYSDERDEWMYKGAVYMEELAGEGDKGSTDGNGAHGPIVHAICMSKSPTEDLEEA